MPRDSNGVYSLPSGYLATTGQKILASQHNPPLEDIGGALTASLPRNGSAPMQADLPMGGFKATGLAPGTDATDAATKAQVDEVSTLLTAWTGMEGRFYRSTAPTGWIKANGGTIGSAASGATTRANADTLALYILFWGQFSNTVLPIQTSAGAASTRGASATADFNANKRLPVFDARGEFGRGWDDGRGVDTGRALGAAQAEDLKSHTHTGTTGAAGTHSHSVPNPSASSSGSGSASIKGPESGGGVPLTADAAGNHAHNFTTNATGGSETRPRNIAALVCIKL